ncbi:5'-3' exonuclease [Agromyces mangrovi Wang et al. 2018]|uniref:5'-3' exonuclease n=1 Tax=Agromyces mangrovi TaxID=1858653 RepID=UPI0025734BD8|nr:5'-3' exonuclease H3TH domain-containing protein [Agromyces mangrovi]BDZ64991.1 5'-3' exonuclease [Agromyces mangrovi]
MPDRLMLLDTASLYFRAFYGLPDTLRAPDGTPVNAVRGLLEFIAKLVGDYEPTHLVACWDDDWRPQWRVELIPSYKAHRVAEVVETGASVEEVPDPLEVQVPVIREVLAALGVPVVGAPDHEADDVIGSLATQATMPVDVVTGDRDLFQLVDDAQGVRVVYTARGMSRLEVLTAASVVEKYRVLPEQYADFAALRGDTSDGLPGVAGIGEKTAASLLGEFGDLDGVRAAATDASSAMSARLRAKLGEASGYLDVAPKVVEVVRDLSLGFDVDEARIIAPDADALEALGERWGLGAAMPRAAAALTAAARG